MNDQKEILWDLLGVLFKAHPWHGVPIGDKQPKIVTTYIEVVPQDTIKYELDKYSGILKVDRPQTYSNVCPTLYGLIPQTLCAEEVADLCVQRTGRDGIVGDDDPLDICVLTEKVFPRGDILLKAIPIGGMRMIDGDEADDKIIAVLQGDAVYGTWTDITDVPAPEIERLKHYFLTYKQAPGSEEIACEITHIYDQAEAYEVIRRSYHDYMSRFGSFQDLLTTALRG